WLNKKEAGSGSTKKDETKKDQPDTKVEPGKGTKTDTRSDTIPGFDFNPSNWFAPNLNELKKPEKDEKVKPAEKKNLPGLKLSQGPDLFLPDVNWNDVDKLLPGQPGKKGEPGALDPKRPGKPDTEVEPKAPGSKGDKSPGDPSNVHRNADKK